MELFSVPFYPEANFLAICLIYIFLHARLPAKLQNRIKQAIKITSTRTHKHTTLFTEYWRKVLAFNVDYYFLGAHLIM